MLFQHHHTGRSFPSTFTCPVPQNWMGLHFCLALVPPATCVQQRIIRQGTPKPTCPEGQEQQDGGDLGQLNSRAHPGRALSWSIEIVNEGHGGGAAYCSPWLQLPTSVTCYFSQVINPIQARLPGARGDNPHPHPGAGREGEVKGSLQQAQ